MKLIGKCKEEFEKWLESNNEIQDTKNRDLQMHHWLTFKGFGSLPDSMQYGVLVDYFLSLGIDYHGIESMYRVKYIASSPQDKELNLLEISTKARTDAKIKSNEIRNEQLKQ